MSFKIDGVEHYIDGASMAGAIVGVPINLASHMGIAIQCIFTGSPLGQLKLQASCDLTQDAIDVANWTDISLAELSGASGSRIFNCRDIYYNWIRVVYSASGGSGSLDVTYNVKGEW